MMTWHRRLRRVLRALARRRDADADMDLELRFHIEQETDALVRAGVDPAEARRRALAAFGGIEWHKDAARDERSFAWVDELRRDVRYATRQIRRAPAFATVVVVTLALGIGANTAIFSVVDGVLLRPLPYPDPDRLVSVGLNGAPPTSIWSRWAIFSYRGEFAALRAESRTLDVAAYTLDAMSLTGDGEATRVDVARVSPETFDLLGVRPLLGRAFSSAEERRGAEPVAMVTHGEWMRRFGGDPGVLGRRLTLDGTSHTIVGVLPPGLSFPARETVLWIPQTIDPNDRIGLWSMSTIVIGRLRPGFTREHAVTELRGMVPDLRTRFPWAMPADYGATADVVPLRDKWVGHARPMLIVLMTAVAAVLLIACANVANLMLARLTTRDRELAVRTALGAGRGRIARQLLVESTVLALVGGAAGLLLAHWGIRVLTGAMGADLAGLGAIGLDGRVLAFAFLLSLAAGAVFGVLPALRGKGGTLVPALKEGGRGGGAGRGPRRVMWALGASEIALAAVLVAGAGLLIKSLHRLMEVHPGFRAENVVVATVTPPTSRYSTAPTRAAFADEVVARVRAIPGVVGASMASAVPFGGDFAGSVFAIEGRPDPAQSGDWPWAVSRVAIESEYFRVMQIPVAEGRAFTASDATGAPRVVVVSRSLAQEYWPDRSVLGARLRFPGDRDWRTIVGVVDDVKWQELGAPGAASLYLPAAQAPPTAFRLVMRTSDPDLLFNALRPLIASIDGDTPLTDVRTITDLMSASASRQRAAAGLLGTFAAVALLLGAVGIYGIFSYAASRRTQEMGVRLALGAGRRDVVRLLVGEGARMAAVGMLAGMIAAFAASGLIRSLLFEVQPADPYIIGTVIAVLGGIAIVATYLPARRAARVDPMIALRGE